jgi:hypothetical protein
MQKWEYRILGKLTEVELNTMGIEGWELISIAFIERGNVYTHYFKRALTSAPSIPEAGKSNQLQRRLLRTASPPGVTEPGTSVVTC